MSPRLPIPGSDAGNWGKILNEYLSVEHEADGKLKPSGSLNTKASKTDLDTLTARIGTSIDSDGTLTEAATEQAVEAVTGSEAWDAVGVTAAQAKGRADIILYEDFATYLDGSPYGKTTSVGGITLITTGAVPPVVTDGTLTSTGGAGYLVAGDLPAKVETIEADLSFASTSGSYTLTIMPSDDNGWPDMLHWQAGIRGGTVTIRGDGGSFDPVLAVGWPALPADGSRHRVRMTLYGNTVIVDGPRGETYAATDPRITDALGSDPRAAYWQAALGCHIHAIALYTTAASGVTSRVDWARTSSTTTPDSNHVVASAGYPWMVRIGPSNGGNPAIEFGAITGIRLPLWADAAIGATTIQLPAPLYGYTSITVGYGDDAETVTVSGSAGGTAPYTITCSALTKAHAEGAAVIATAPAGRLRSIYMSVGTGLLTLPANTVVDGLMELGTNRDAGIQRVASRAVGAVAAGGLAYIRDTPVTTTQRLAIASPTNGLCVADIDLGKPVWYIGGAWVDALGDEV